MANPYYNFINTFIAGTAARSDAVNQELDAVTAGFDLLPTVGDAVTRGVTYLGVESGSGNTFTVTMPDTRTAYQEGDRVAFRATHSNTGSAVINVDTIGAVTAVRTDDTALESGDILQDVYYEFIYDSASSHFQMLNMPGSWMNDMDNRVDWAEEWAVQPEDTLVSTAAGGNGVSDYSALHHAAKAAASEASATATYDAFDDRYLGDKASDPTLDNDGDALLTGALYWNTANDAMRVYTGTVWVDVGSSTANITEWTATAGQTAFTGTDENGKTLSYTVGFLMVFQNGVLLDPDDYTATNGTTMTLDTGAVAGDIINMIGFGTFDVANTYTKAEVDANTYTQTQADATFAPISIGRKNIIINGDFGVAQRDTSFTGLSGFPFTLDRWRWVESGTSIVDILQISNSSEPPGRAYMSMSVTTGDASLGATEYAGFLYQVEGNDAIAFGWNSTSQSDKKNLTLSFWSAHHTTGTYCVAFRNSATDRSYIAEYTQAVANTWEKQTINVSAPTDGTWLVDEGRGLQITFSMGAGTTLAAPAADTWYSADYHATTNQVNNVANTSCRARFAAVQLEVGDIATDFELRSFAEELAMCQRYYEKSYSDGDLPGTVTTNGFWSFYLTGLPVSAHTMAQVVRFAVPKPTATYSLIPYSQVTGTSGKLRDGGAGADITPTIDAKGTGGFRIYATGTSSSGIDISGHWVCDAEI